MAQGFNDTITNIYTFPFTANSLLTFDLVHIQPQQQNTQQLNTKPEHIVFIRFVPGEIQSGNKRTYNFKNKIVLKYSLLEVEGLSFVLKNNAETNGFASNPYRKFSDSQQGGSKSVSIWQASQDKQMSGKTVTTRTIFIQAQSGSDKISLSMSPHQAYSISSALTKMFNVGTDLEIKRMMNAPKFANNNQSKGNSGGVFIAPEPDNLENEDNPF